MHIGIPGLPCIVVRVVVRRTNSDAVLDSLPLRTTAAVIMVADLVHGHVALR